MKLCAALDTSTTKTAICIVNSRDGAVVFEVTVATDPAIIFAALAPFRTRLERVGHEAGTVAPWLHRELAAMGLPMALMDPRRFVKSKTVGAHFELTSRRIQTGDSIDNEGHISKCGDGEVRTVLYEAGSAMLVRSKQWCSVKSWGLRIAAKRGHKRAVVAVARKLAVIVHRMWLDGGEFRFSVAGDGETDGVAGKEAATPAAA
jgi:transposase